MDRCHCAGNHDQVNNSCNYESSLPALLFVVLPLGPQQSIKLPGVEGTLFTLAPRPFRTQASCSEMIPRVDNKVGEHYPLLGHCPAKAACRRHRAMYDDNDAADGCCSSCCVAMASYDDDDVHEGLQCEKGFQCKLQTASSHSGTAAAASPKLLTDTALFLPRVVVIVVKASI